MDETITNWNSFGSTESMNKEFYANSIYDFCRDILPRLVAFVPALGVIFFSSLSCFISAWIAQ